jgi:Ca-activated chloride channel family protein
MKRISFVVMLLLLAATQVWAAAGSIKGVVLDEQNQPVLGAVVQVIQGGITKAGASTNENGAYDVKPLAAGRYDVKLAYAGYKTHMTKNVIVSPDKATVVNITLTVDTRSLNEVQVVEYKKPLIDKYNSKTVTSERIEKMPARTTESGAIAPGVYQQNGDLSIAGAREDRAMYIIDGVQTPKHMKRRAPLVDNARVQYLPPVPYPNSGESYAYKAENDFKLVRDNPLSTLSVDVDRASYSNIRRLITTGQPIPPEAVRVEEMINYFDYQYPQPEGSNPIAIVTEVIDCPWQPGHKLLHIGMQAKTVSAEHLPPSNIVFLIDVSGSMNSANKLPLVKSAMKMLTSTMRAQDKVSIVVYAGNAGLVLPPTSGSDKRTIYKALDRLEAGGSTAGGAGIQLAYATALQNFVKGGNNRVVLATDGDFNVGVSAECELENLIAQNRNKGVYLTCLGFGMGNYKDAKMEILADKGNGNYAYIDNEQEAHKTLVKEFGGTIFTIAKDVKAQIEFNPGFVQSYRLVGYENRLLNDEDFKDDKKDAGEMGSGHTVTMLYEIVPTGYHKKGDIELKYGREDNVVRNLHATGIELATVKFRYKKPNSNTSSEMQHIIPNFPKRIDMASDNIRFASSVAMFGMMLKNSPHKGNTSYKHILALAQSAKGKDKDGYRAEYISLVQQVSGKLGYGEDPSLLGWSGDE